MTEEPKLDYSLTGKTSEEAVARGLASAAWYHSPIPRDQFRSLLARRNGPAVRDTLLWFALLFGTGYWGYLWWGSLWAAIPFALYGVLYASSSDSRWHESSHGTAFKSDWMNNALYELASFMVFRESTCWRWSHNRHHSDTIIVGRDPEIAVPRPADLFGLILAFLAVRSTRNEFGEMLLHAAGVLNLALPASVMVGDRASDLGAGDRAGLGRAILLAGAPAELVAAEASGRPFGTAARLSEIGPLLAA